MIRLLEYIFILFMLTSCFSTQIQETNIAKPNILFISIDDLRPELGCYGNSIAITPNIDALAADGLLFDNAYCQQAICSPSRASLMTGARPETINVIENFTDFRVENPNIITLPQQLKLNGYETINCGKVYHGRFTDKEKSWSKDPDKSLLPYSYNKLPGGYALLENQEEYKRNKQAMIDKYGDKVKYGLGMGPAFEKANVEDHVYLDGMNTDLAIVNLREMIKKSEKPFFMGLGYVSPHLNFTAPKKYWDLYNRDSINLTTQTKPPKNGAAMGLHASFELRTRSNIPKKGAIPDSLGKDLLHAYLATSSFVDAQIGKVIQFLKKEGLYENTVILLWSDHGYHLGEMGIWGKATNYEIATRVPLIIKASNHPIESKGKRTTALVELLDMYPTLCELSGVALPKHLEGKSFVPLLSNPEKKWKEAVFTVYPNPALREWAANPLSKGMRETYFGPLIEDVEMKIQKQIGEKWNRDEFENDIMGYAMRTKQYRLIVWKNRHFKDAKPVYIELYNHLNDPNEMENIANIEQELTSKLLKKMTQLQSNKKI